MKEKFLKYKDMQYVVRFPRKYQDGEEYPVILLLHGAGWRGQNIHTIMDHTYFQVIDEYEDFPFVTIAPMCSKDTWFDVFETLQELVCKIMDEPYVDKKRIYLMGASMGGYATWQLAMSMPQVFAACCPICGGGMYWNAQRLVDMPIWAFHGKKDPTVLVEESIKMVDAVNSCGGNAKITIYPENAHNSWTDTFNNPEVFEWFLRYRR